MSFTSIRKTCSCGNISVKGQHYTRVYKTGLSEATQELISKNPNLFLHIRTAGVGIMKTDNVIINKASDFHITFTCAECGETLSIYLTRGNVYAIFDSACCIPGTGKRTKGDFLRLIPRQLRTIVSVNHDIDPEDSVFKAASTGAINYDGFVQLSSSDRESEDEDDFNLMFSNNIEPIVGSYTESGFAYGVF